MSRNKFYTLSKLVSAGRKLAENCETVSFDLFDTLLIRRIHDPDLVKLPVARYIAARLEEFGIEMSFQAVQKVRDRVEQRQRRETGQRFDDHEACYPVFMTRVLQELTGSQDVDKLLADVTRYELEMESSVLVVRQELVDWLLELRESGKRVFIISDIYLPAEHLKILVGNAGLLEHVEDVISSADTFLAKASGKAFPYIKERYDLDPASWLHIGDNPISDGVRPDQFGIKSLIIHDGMEKFRKGIIKRYVNYSKGRPFYRGRALQQLMLPL